VPDGGEVVLKIFRRVFLHPMLFQEGVELVARGDAQQRAELVAREAPLTVGFQADGFQGGAGGVLAGWGEAGGNSSGISSVTCMIQLIILAAFVSSLVSYKMCLERSGDVKG
jgi:hypothetical protein